MGKKLLIKIQFFIFISLFLINLINCFVPETGFDALWYHLTLPKLWLDQHRWFFPGGLLYYSGMPRLAETFFIPALAFMGYLGPKLIQLIAGLFTCLAILKLGKLINLNKFFRLLAVNLFYATWLVSWQSSSAYVDLIRTAFEVWGFYFIFTNKKLFGGIFLGLAMSVKWQAITSLVIIIFLSPLSLIPALITFSPWSYLAYRLTGNPIYPLNEKFMISTQLAQVAENFYHPLEILKRLLVSPIFFTRPFDGFLSPVAGILLILAVFSFFISKNIIRKFSFISLAGAVSLLLTPPPSIRYYLPYLPFLCLISVYFVSKLKTNIRSKFIYLFTLSSLLMLGGRTIVLSRNLPFLLKKQSVNEYLTHNSAKLTNAFIDTDDFIKNNLPSNGSYLISNLNNLFYFPYSFDHVSWANPNKKYNYLITRGVNSVNSPGILLHTNSIGIQVFKL